jgi:D-serine deaminase-like pyridoxal phosphate-dependent protein
MVLQKHGLPQRVSERLEALRDRPITADEKGFGFLDGATAASIAAARPPLHEAGFSYPLLTLRESALDNNARAMAAYCAAAGVELAPHGKTAMSPELGALQLSHGAWAITVATIGQLRTYRGYGFPRLLLANELLDQAGIAWLAAEMAAHPDFEPYCYADNPRSIEHIIRTFSAASPHRALQVLVEIGHAGGRTGCRTDAEAIEVAKAVAGSGGVLRLAGVAAFEGSIHAGTVLPGQSVLPGQTVPEQVAVLCQRMVRVGLAVRDLAPDPEDFIVTAGGSAKFDIVVRELSGHGMRVVLRSGAYLFYDNGLYAEQDPQARAVPGAPALRPAIELWAQVLSRPEPDLALLGFGRRDAGFDAGLPVPLNVPGEVFALNDQHAFLRVASDSPLAPGDLVCLGVSHPCTTLDKWRVMPVVADDGTVTDVVHAFF